jgi:hypothetical protein
LPPVSTTTGANFAPSFASVVDTGGKIWKKYQAADLNLNAKIYYFTTQRCANKIFEIFLNEDFFHLPPVSTTPVVHLEPRISPQIF